MTNTLTFAELAVLLENAQATTDRLHLAEEREDSGVLSAGLASLFARGLIETGSETFGPIPELVPLLDCLTSPSEWIEVGFARGDRSSGLQVFAHGELRVLVTPSAFGTYSFQSLEPESDLSRVVADFVREFLDDEEPGAAFVTIEPDRPGLAVRKTAENRYELALENEDAASVEELDLESTLAAIQHFLRAPSLRET
jgi:hypothetical protein